jgi:hypothetical protein
VKDYLLAAKKGVKRVTYADFSGKCGENAVYESERLRREAGADGFINLCENPGDGVYKTLDILKNENNAALSGKQLFDAMKKHNIYPETKYEMKHGKRFFKDFFLYAFSRQRFKSYFFLAVIMFLFSYISPYRMYYLAFSAVLFLFCVFSLMNKKYAPKTKGCRIFE